MELGEKLRLARQEAGLSQRQLCGDTITRNMLSQIEHGTARPSMDTLRILAARLGKPMSFFLDEEAAMSPNQALMEQVRDADPGEQWLMLKGFQHPDPLLEWEWCCRSFLAGLAVAEKALEENKHIYARQLLEETSEFRHGIPELERRRLLLLGKISADTLSSAVRQLPSLDEELLLRAEAALADQDSCTAAALLAAAQDQENPRWNLLQGKTLILQKDYSKSIPCLQKAEQAFPAICWPLLEECCRESGDFKGAYEYACKQR